MSEPTAPAKPNRKYWITIRVVVDGRILETDLVAEAPLLNQDILMGAKKRLCLDIVKEHGGVIPKMTEPVILACIPLDE